MDGPCPGWDALAGPQSAGQGQLLWLPGLLQDERLQPGSVLVATSPKLPSADPLQDNHPLASLPLLGYSLTIPSESEDIHKDYVFKLHFKSHVYYFRAESEYTFERYVPLCAGHL